MCSYLRKLVVLVVDDDPEVENVLRLMFTLRGHDTLSAFDSDDALQVARGHGGPIDLLVTDVLMPGRMNGFELAVQLVTERPGIRVVLTSALDCCQIGCAGLLLLPKPFTPEQVYALVEQVLTVPPPTSEALYEILRPFTVQQSRDEGKDAERPMTADRRLRTHAAVERAH